ncbi:superoxide dismutase [Acetobacteraceae bacterium]|nr:superoxide dismutase [Acetobacteraceae bacterium]
MSFQLPPLPFADTALAEKGMKKETLDLHHGKHHQGYVNALNGLVEKNPELQGKSLEELVKFAAKKPELSAVLNNAGQHYNHSLFWKSLSPDGGKIPATLEAKIKEDFGSVEAFKTAFKTAATTQFGSGWAWLVLTSEGKLAVTKTPNAESPLSQNTGKALLVMDVWEHAYYLDFQNRRPDFTDNFLNNLANYTFAEEVLKQA